MQRFPAPHVTPLALALSLSLGPSPVWGQPPTEKGQTAARAAASSKEGEKGNVLEADPRLNTRITLKKRTTTVANTLRELNTLTDVKLTAEGNEVLPQKVSFFYKDTPLKEVLASLAAVRDWEWERRRGGTLVLRERYDPRRMDVFRPHSEAQMAVYRKGREFIDQLSRQPQALQQAIRYTPPDPRDPSGVAFRDLPAALQQTLRELFAARQQDRADHGHLPSRISPDTLDDTRIRFEVNPGQRQTGYHIMAFNHQSSFGAAFSVATDPKERHERIVPVSELRSTIWYGAKDDEASRREALERDPRLNTKVTLRVQRATLADALHALAPLARINFVQEQGLGPKKPVVRSDSFEAAPLKEVMDRLATLYGYTWGYKDGVFVWHLAPPGSARQGSTAPSR